MDTVPAPGKVPADYPWEPTDPAERARQLAEAEADVNAGHGVPNEIVRAWLLEVSEKGYVPPPCDP